MQITTVMDIQDREFHELADYIYNMFGIHLPEKKRHLVKTRLNSLMSQGQYESYRDYISYIKRTGDIPSILELIDCITTNHTFFYREKSHFEFLRSHLLPQMESDKIRNNSRKIRIWCAGCSSGEEAYTLGILLHDYFGDRLKEWDLRILATDISITALSQAAEGLYPAEKLRNLPPNLQSRYFTPRGADREVKPPVKNLVAFRRLNLMREHYPFQGTFDVVFCRNVMIYFDRESRDSLVGKIHSVVPPGGYFFIGHTETLQDAADQFQFVTSAVYRRTGRPR